jgi:hypothetical protein
MYLANYPDLEELVSIRKEASIVFICLTGILDNINCLNYLVKMGFNAREHVVTPGIGDEVYANGDGSDSWCKNGNQVNYTLYPNKIYWPPVEIKMHCFFLKLFDPTIGLYAMIHTVPGFNCFNGLMEKVYFFICSELTP